MPGYPSAFVEFWGPSAWKFLHSVSFTFPDNPSEDDQAQYTAFFRSLGNILPCPSCRGHYKDFMKKTPIDVSSREALAEWVWKAHDNVNRWSGKTSPPFEDVKRAYDDGIPKEVNAFLMKAKREDPIAFREVMGSPYIAWLDPQSTAMGRHESATASTTAAAAAASVAGSEFMLNAAMLMGVVLVLALLFWFFSTSSQATGQTSSSTQTTAKAKAP